MKKSERIVLEMKDTDLKEKFIKMRAEGNKSLNVKKHIKKQSK